MRMGLLRGLLVALLCGAWALGETLDEAVDRLGKAAAATRDVTVKFTMKGARYHLPDDGGKAVKSRTMAGTGEFQMLRDGDKCLMRVSATLTEERHAEDPAAAPEKREQRLLAVNDGAFSWKEDRRSDREEPRVIKEPLPKGGGLGLGRGSIALLDAPFKTAGIKEMLEQVGQDDEVKLAAKGTVAGRPTTTIEVATKAERLKDMDAALRVMRPVRTVVQFDDATGAVVSGQDFNEPGDTLMSYAATELKANTGLDKKLFAYTPPEGARVRDRTQPPEPVVPEK